MRGTRLALRGCTPLESFDATFQALNLEAQDRGLLSEAATILIRSRQVHRETQGQEQQDHARHEEAQVQRNDDTQAEILTGAPTTASCLMSCAPAAFARSRASCKIS